MSMLAERVEVVIGADTHRDTIALAMIDARTGQVLGSTEVAADGSGYAAARLWASVQAGRRAWAIEGTGSYGAGLAAALADDEELVFEIDRVRRGRRNGKNDPKDATRIAREALERDQLPPVPRQRGRREALRVTLTSREAAVRARTAAWNELHALVVTAAEPVRRRLRHCTGTKLIAAIAELPREIGIDSLEIRAAVRVLRAVATRIAYLSDEILDYEQQLDELMRNHPLLAEPGVGPITAAQILISWSHAERLRSEAAFAALAGVAPLEASSGRTVRHRLSPMGDRALNRALHTVARNRIVHDAETRTYLRRRRAEGLSDREIIRCLKRSLARRFYRRLNRLAAQPLQPQHAG